jgi:glycosyltransferase involved in cell wall biosynthesis
MHLPLSDPERGSFTYRGLSQVIQREQPRVLVTNGFSLATTKLWLRSFSRPTPYIIWSGAIRAPGRTEQRLRRLHRKLLVQRAAGFVVYGSLARDYVLDLGAPVERVAIGINTVDTAYFAHKGNMNVASKEGGKKRLLFVGDLIPRKGADRLLKIVHLLVRKRHDFVLDIVGSGSEQPKLEQMADELGIRPYVDFEGFKQKKDIPYHLDRASCFVFPTRHDIWGLVLVEAMAAGLPCLSSTEAGATRDLIQDGRTGFAVDFSDINKATETLHWLLDNPEQSEDIGRRARAFIQESVTLTKSAEGFVEAIERALHEQR